MKKKFKAILNADWGRDIVITGKFRNKEIARKKLEETKNMYGDPGIATIIKSIKEVV